MSYRTVKKAYKRTFGKADYVRDNNEKGQGRAGQCCICKNRVAY